MGRSERLTMFLDVWEVTKWHPGHDWCYALSDLSRLLNWIARLSSSGASLHLISLKTYTGLSEPWIHICGARLSPEGSRKASWNDDRSWNYLCLHSSITVSNTSNKQSSKEGETPSTPYHHYEAKHPDMETMDTSTMVSTQSIQAPSIPFTNVKRLFEKLNRVSGDILIVTSEYKQNSLPLSKNAVLTLTDVSFSDFSAIESERDLRGRSIKLRHWDARSQALVIALPTPGHRALHYELTRALDLQLRSMGIADKWADIGGATYTTRDFGEGRGGRHRHRSSAEGDTAGFPVAGLAVSNSWPTLVVLSHTSPAVESLYAAVRWWFAASEHYVKIVLVERWDGERRRIVVEKWEEEEEEENAQAEPVCRQTIAIARRDAASDLNEVDSFVVDGGALELSFRHLFGKDPVTELGEGDIFFSVWSLQRFARNCWYSLAC